MSPKPFPPFVLCWLLSLLALTPPPVLAQSPTAGRALSFSATGTVTIRHQPELDPYPLTVTAWVRTTQTTGGSGLVNKYLSGAFCGWQMYLLNGNVRAWYFADATNHVWDGSDGLDGGPVADGNWHHLAFTVDAAGGTIYVDGVQTASRGWSGTPTRTRALQDLTLGSYPGAGPGFYRGTLDEVTLWNVRLSAAKLAELRSRSLRGDEEGLVAYYRCDETSGPLVQDSAGAGGSHAGLLSAGVMRFVSTAPLTPGVPTNGLPVIQRVPAPAEVEAGMPVRFTVVDGAGTWNHQWSRDGQDLPQATEDSLSIAAVSPGDAGDYRVRSFNGSRSVESLPVPLRVLTVPQLLTEPVGEVAGVGSSVTFAPVVQGGRPLNFQWYHEGTPLARAVSNGLTLSPVQWRDAGEYWLVVGNAFGAVTSSVARLQLSARPLTNALVLHLDFDNNLQDSSGRGNHAVYVHTGPTASPEAIYTRGQIGKAFRYATASDGNRFEYVTLGYPSDLQFGADTDFTVSVWINYATTQTGDLPFLCNKDWDKSHHPGWAITTQSGGQVRMNITGPREGTDFFSTAQTPVLRDSRWHHLLTSFQRGAAGQAAYAYLYVDGRLVNKTAMAVAGTIDTAGQPFTYASPQVSPQQAWALNIGQDGTGVYYDKGGVSAFGGLLDDLGIWRRALTAEEANAIYVAGINGLDLTQAVVPVTLVIAPTTAAGFVALSWSGGSGLRLETADNLAGGPWTGIPGTGDTNATTVAVGEQPAYFRVVQ
ncbi:MAG TPA: LamG-like jellyroll fold domain-containing protein [Candidatus Limnocylindria bacterium]|nr:LamG-like jellyroll fold domain-containing protein [Candidatus Limnocylindria bacterium]